MAKIISKVSRVSDLPEITHIWDGMKAIVADDGSNYIIDISKIKGKKIEDIFGSMSTESGGKNIIYIRFDNGQVEKLIVYNGTDGDKGKTGIIGPVGEQGDAAIINYKEKDDSGRGVVGVIQIINNSESDDINSMWSGFMGKTMNDNLYDINETFITEAEFDLLFNDVKYIYAEFITEQDNIESTLFNNDTNDHTVYRKYWTFEDGDTETYYIKRADGTYDSVSASLWEDIYLGEKEGFFPVTSSMNTQDIPIYYLDKQTGQYLEVVKLYKTVERSTIDDEGNTVDVIQNIYLGDKIVDAYYIPELDASLYSKYTVSTNSWDFILNTDNDLTWTIYQRYTTSHIENVVDENGNNVLDENGNITTEEIIDEHYTPLTVYYDIRQEKYFIEEVTVNDTVEHDVELNTSAVQDFYQLTRDGYTQITKMSVYLAIPTVRYYKRDTITNLYNEVNLDDWDKNDDYIIAYKDAKSGNYIFDRHYTKDIYGDIVAYNNVVSIKTIDLYYSTESEGPREFYTLRYTYEDVLDDNGDVIEGQQIPVAHYDLIPIPKWIVAEFITNDEDVNVLLLNANDDLGEEDNTIQDTTIENLDTYVHSTPISRIVPGYNKVIYKKEADNNYKLVNLEKDIIYNDVEYYTLNDEYAYEEITGEYARNNSIIELYERNDNNTYSIFRGTIIDSNVYYIRKNTYTLIDDVDSYLREYTIYLIYGEPQVLPISIYPSTSIRENLIIEYDPDYINFYEDGRIAAVTGDTIEDSQIFIRSEKNPEVVYAIIHVYLITAIKTISFDSNNPNEVTIGNSIDIKYTILPETATNSNIVWSASKFVDEDNVEHDMVEFEQINGNTVRIKGVIAGTTSIIATAKDGQGARSTFRLEIITPVAKLYWDQENIKYVPPVYYSEDDIRTHNLLNPDDPWEVKENTIIMTPEYYYIIALHNKEYELKPVIEPNDVIYKTINWTTDDQDIASVNRNNILVGSNLGETTIYGYLDKFPELDPISLKVIVNKAITGITVNPSALSINVNTKNKITANIEPNDLSNSSIKWISSNENIVKILNDSIDPINNVVTIESVGIGSAQIIAQGFDGEEQSSVSGTCEITVTIPTKDITVNGENINDGIIYVGCKDDENNTTEISAIITRDNNYAGEDIYKLGVIWDVVDSSIATVEGTGEKNLNAIITGNNIGKTTIIAKAADGSGVFGTIQVQVIKLTEKISFENDEYSMEVGDTLVLAPKFIPESTNEIVIWKSSDTNIAKVKESGIVYALSPGTATITVTATDGSKQEATCEITIQ